MDSSHAEAEPSFLVSNHLGSHLIQETVSPLSEMTPKPKQLLEQFCRDSDRPLPRLMAAEPTVFKTGSPQQKMRLVVPGCKPIEAVGISKMDAALAAYQKAGRVACGKVAYS